MTTCQPLPPLSERVNSCDAYSPDYRARYFGRLTEVEYRNGYLSARFGEAFIRARIDVLPEWIHEGCEVEIETSKEGVKISPLTF